MAQQNFHINLGGGRGGAGGAGGQQGGGGGAGQGAHIDMQNENVTMYINSAAGTPEVDKKKIIDWISPINFFPRHQEVVNSRQENTGGWIFEVEAFKNWESAEDAKRLLWCSGVSGAGKTVLMSVIVDHFTQIQKQDPDIGCGFLYLNYQQSDTQTLQNLLAAIWRQLIYNKSTGIDDAKAMYLSCQERETTLSLEEIQSLLQDFSPSFKQIYIMLDALNEYSSNRQDLISNILQIGKNVKLLVMSRPNIAAPEEQELSRLLIEAHPEDIEKFISSNIKQYDNLHALIAKDSNLQSRIIKELTETANGM
ncbi:Ankyrin 2,3/unc44 [Mycena chlorophos]|uniref:Ankyrin 2,3/unc44 n=1 Tax=Mycena chlorophos TaxID=658473 RepID=A0A8H6SCN3_MYCCL|nr:Ankyrin 2,3/unc44 [Mycena chlorophos]